MLPIRSMNTIAKAATMVSLVSNPRNSHYFSFTISEDSCILQTQQQIWLGLPNLSPLFFQAVPLFLEATQSANQVCHLCGLWSSLYLPIALLASSLFLPVILCCVRALCLSWPLG